MVLLSALVAAFTLSTAQAHSTVERLIRISYNGGAMVGTPGYPRGYLNRNTWTGTGDNDFDHQTIWRINPPIENNTLAHPYQRSANYSTDFPALVAAPGDLIALQYHENGHTTLLPPNPPRPLNRGTVYVYGTYEFNSSALLVDVHYQWNEDGTGGDGKGKLLATRNFDDGQCYQISQDPERLRRAAAFPVGNEAPGYGALLCQNDLALADDLEIGKPYTLIWVWDWPAINAESVDTTKISPVTPEGWNFTGTPIVTPELYTTVMDIDIVDPCDDKLGAVKGPSCDTKKKVTYILQETDYNNRSMQDQCLNNFLVDISGLSHDTSRVSPSDDGTASADPSTSSASTSALSSSSTKTMRIKTEVVTVPMATVTVYASSTETVTDEVTVTGTISSPALTSDTTTTGSSISAAAPPSVSPFLSSSTPKARKGRRSAAKWTFGQD
jgi:hypothetical protein